MTEKQGQKDRINYSAGRKISDGNYGSIDFHISYSSDIEDSEDELTALRRVASFVEKSLNQRLQKAAKEMHGGK